MHSMTGFPRTHFFREFLAAGGAGPVEVARGRMGAPTGGRQKAGWFPPAVVPTHLPAATPCSPWPSAGSWCLCAQDTRPSLHALLASMPAPAPQAPAVLSPKTKVQPLLMYQGREHTTGSVPSLPLAQTHEGSTPGTHLAPLPPSRPLTLPALQKESTPAVAAAAAAALTHGPKLLQWTRTKPCAQQCRKPKSGWKPSTRLSGQPPPGSGLRALQQHAAAAPPPPRSAGVSARLYNEFLDPMLLAILFAPGTQLSAAAALDALYYFVLAHQADFDVR